MVLDKFKKLYLKKKKHAKIHPQPNESSSSSSSSLHKFQSNVSKQISQLALESKSESEILSLSWFQRCFSLLPFINNAFAKLVEDIDYPTSQWKVDSIDEYLNYSISLLELLNLISFALSHLGHARLCLAHALSSTSLSRKYLKEIQLERSFNPKFDKSFHSNGDKAKIFIDKELIVQKGVKEMKSIVFWVCGVMLSCLYANSKPYMELRKMVGGFESSIVAKLDYKISEKLVKKKPNFDEINEINNVVAHHVDSDEVRDDTVMELQKKLCELEKIFDSINKEVDCLFNDVMSKRTQLVDSFVLKK